jgi:hypothetical protein
MRFYSLSVLLLLTACSEPMHVVVDGTGARDATSDSTFDAADDGTGARDATSDSTFDAADDGTGARDATSDSTFDAADDGTGARDATSDSTFDAADDGTGAPVDSGLADACVLGLPPVPATGVTIAAPFREVYRAYQIGPVPGLRGTRYSGCLIDRHDRNLLYIGADSESPSGALYAIRVVRACDGHIVGFDGTARRIASTPYIDANLFFDRDGNILYSMWPTNQLAVLPPGADMPSQVLDFASVGVPASASPGGVAFVPMGFTGAGELRIVGWPTYTWHRVTFTYAAGRYTLRSADARATLTQGSGGIAYVPPGSPLIDRPTIVMAEWSSSVSFFDADANGDIVPSSRRPFLTGLTNAWGAYFEPVTGDFMFPSWGGDQLILVRGFAQPPN